LLTRRQILLGAGACVAGAFGLSTYAFAIEPYRLRVQGYRLRPRQWPADLKLKVVALADLHTAEPWMPTSRVEQIVEQTNALKPDLIVMLGDFVAGHRLVHSRVPKDRWTRALSNLRAPLGRYAILGNHDWWEDGKHQFTRQGPTAVGSALEAAGIPVLENDAVRLQHDGRPFWLAGLGDQWAFYRTENGSKRDYRKPRFGFQGMDDLPATLRKMTDDAPAILLAHEPDIFPQVPHRVALTMCGHTHGGQVQFLGWAPKVPSMFGQRYLYGVITEPDPADTQGRDRHLIVSGGLGCSGLPIRFGRPPELTVVELGGSNEEEQPFS